VFLDRLVNLYKEIYYNKHNYCNLRRLYNTKNISVQYIIQFTLLYLLPVNTLCIIHDLYDIVLYIYVPVLYINVIVSVVYVIVSVLYIHVIVSVLYVIVSVLYIHVIITVLYVIDPSIVYLCHSLSVICHIHQYCIFMS
jgi:hypothetical protein